MKNETKRDGILRIETLFDALHNGHNADEADRIVNEKVTKERVLRREAQLKNGNGSEERVAEALSRMDGVIQVRRTEKFGDEDRNGIDIVVDLKDPMVRRVRIQVKSSGYQIGKFKRRMMSEKGLARSELTKWMRANNFMIINGNSSHDDIVDNFSKGVYRIRAYREKEINHTQ